MARSQTYMEESVMASVRMSGELRDKIFKNFEQQLYKVYEDNSGLQDYLKSILESFYSVEERQLMQDYLDVHERLFRMKYPKKNHEKFSPKKYFTVEANNHFGIKCHDWNGKKIYHDDDEEQECFRKYDNPEYSYRDHSLFLSNRGRYSFLFDLERDNYKQWAKGLKKAGYATDPKYPQKLIDLIERYELYKYDNIVLKKKNKKYKVRRGDTLYSISEKFNMPVEALVKLNNLNGDILKVGQTLMIKK